MKKIDKLLNNIDEDKYLDNEKPLSENEKEKIFNMTMDKIKNSSNQSKSKEKIISLKKTVAIILASVLMISTLSFASDYFSFDAQLANLLNINGEKVTLITLPYPSEKRLNEVIKGDTEREQQISYSKKVGDLFRKLEENFEEDSINIAVSHIFVVGGESTESERPIELGGSLLVQKSDLPQNSQYTALGHLHKPQKASERLNAYYSGSPIQYSKSERVYSKGAKIVEVHPGEDAIIEDIYFKNYKPIEVFKCKGIEEAINICEENKDKNIWSYFEIVTDEVINQKNIKTMKSLLKDIIEIKPIINQSYEYEHVDMREKTMKELFVEYYKFRNKVEPKGELLDLFLQIVEEEGDDN